MSWPAQETALVTGAASGMGLGISRALVAAGARVALVDINAERLAAAVEELTAAGGEVLALEFDVSDPEAWQGAADRAEEALGPVSIVCSRVLGISGQPVHGLGRNRHQALATSTCCRAGSQIRPSRHLWALEASLGIRTTEPTIPTDNTSEPAGRSC